MKEYIVRYEDNKFTIEGEIVRCKYCKWKVQHLCMNKDAQAFYMEVDADDYCSYGEKQVTGKNACGDYFDEEWLYNELEQIAEIIQLSPETPTNSEETSTNEVETPTISEKESVEGDLFNKSLWRMGMHDTNVRPCTMADTSTDTDLISRQAAIEAIVAWTVEDRPDIEMPTDLVGRIKSLPPVEDMGEVSDGYHTFNQLYHQRAVLFATIVNQNKGKAWKSWKHEDGKFCFDKEGEWFIVGVDTPEGSYTYHYEKKYWDMFDCEELDRGKHWDGHTEDDVTRLLSLQPVEPKPVCEDAISRADTKRAICKECDFKGDCGGECTDVEVVSGMPPVEPKRPKGEWVENDDFTCSECGYHMIVGGGAYNFCPNCGCQMERADMRGNSDEK